MTGRTLFLARFAVVSTLVLGCARPSPEPEPPKPEKPEKPDVGASAPEDAGPAAMADASSPSAPIVREPLAVHVRKPLYLKLESASRPLLEMRRGDEAIVQLSGANSLSVMMEELLLRYEPDANVEVLGPATAVFRNVPYATEEKDLIHPKIRVRLEGEGGELRVFYGFAASGADEEAPREKRRLVPSEAKMLGFIIGLGNRAEGAPPP